VKIYLFILLIFSFCFACKTAKPIADDGNHSDTSQFTYLYSEALKNKTLGNSDLAINQFIQCMNINTESSASAYQLSQIYLEKKDLNNAKKFADFCLLYKPDNEWFLLHRSLIARDLNEREIYTSIYKKLVKLFPDNISYSYELAVIYFEEKNYDKSLFLLNEIEESVGVDENISFLKNNNYYQLKRYDGIQAELFKLKVFFPDSVKYIDLLAEFYITFNMPDKAVNLYKSVLEIDPANVNALYGLSLNSAKTGQYKIGYNLLLQMFNCSGIQKDKIERLCTLYLDLPIGILSDNEIDSIYTHLIDIKDINSDYINDYLSFLYNRKQLTNAERVAKKTIQSRPENYWSWDYLFNILLTQSRYEELKQYSWKALEYFPNHATVYFYYGYSLFITKKINEAINYFETGLDYVIDNKPLELQFILSLAESYHLVGKNKKSDEYFERYLRNDSTNAYLLNNYAYYLTQRNDELDKAEHLSLKSIEIEPFNSTFLDTYSWILYSKNEFSRSLNYIQRAYRYGGNKNQVIVEHYGDILVKLNNYEEALERYNEALSLNKNNNLLLEKIRSLKKQ
jgi:predicted Zn-dependent protease